MDISTTILIFIAGYYLMPWKKVIFWNLLGWHRKRAIFRRGDEKIIADIWFKGNAKEFSSKLDTRFYTESVNHGYEYNSYTHTFQSMRHNSE
jgi:phage terminase large subunit-like protein